jgi:molybdopterin-containing oxidoreductase family iron-sulfur binding subunit
MAKPTILVNLDRCIGCWSCAMACKVNNGLPEGAWWATVRTLGNGEGIDRPAGSWPSLRMGWMPVWSKDCVLCSGRTAAGEEPHCTSSCPTLALTYGDLSDAGSDASIKLDALAAQGFKVFSLPAWENNLESVVYATKR